MATLAQIRAGLSVRLATIAAFDGKIYETMPGDVTPPAAVIMLGSGAFLRYKSSFDSHDLGMLIRVLASRAEDDSAQERLDEFIEPTGASSVFAAIAGDPSLGGIVDYAQVVAATDYGSTPVGGIEMLGCDFPVEIGVR